MTHSQNFQQNVCFIFIVEYWIFAICTNSTKLTTIRPKNVERHKNLKENSNFKFIAWNWIFVTKSSIKNITANSITSAQQTRAKAMYCFSLACANVSTIFTKANDYKKLFYIVYRKVSRDTKITKKTQILQK